jgi:hypothetical protein
MECRHLGTFRYGEPTNYVKYACLGLYHSQLLCFEGLHFKDNVSSQTTMRQTNHQSNPDWENFRLLGDCLLMSYFKIVYRSSPNYSAFLRGKSWAQLLRKKWAGLHFWVSFHKLNWSPCSPSAEWNWSSVWKGEGVVHKWLCTFYNVPKLAQVLSFFTWVLSFVIKKFRSQVWQRFVYLQCIVHIMSWA